MPWGAAVGAVVGSVANSALSDSGSKNGGAGTTTGTKDPWLAAQPWMRSNMAQGQNLQQRYQDSPFNQGQLDAYRNMGNQSDYMRALVPSLLGTASRQQLGFDRSNPDARPEAYRFDAGAGTPGATTQALSAPGGLLSMLRGGGTTGDYGASALNSAPRPAAPPQAPSQFRQETMEPGAALMMSRNMRPGMGVGDIGAAGGMPLTGGYGDFQYGTQPEPGTKAFFDMSQYFAYGGKDPMNLYGKRNMPEFDNRFSGLLGMPVGPEGGPSAGSGAAGGGVGAAGGAGAGAGAGGVGW